MRHYLVFILLTVLLYIHLRLILRRRLIKAGGDCASSKREFDALSLSHEKLKNENLVLGEAAQDTIELYDITKEICKTLDETKVFGTFRELISRYVKIEECKFVKEETDLLKYPQYHVFPLKLSQHSLGYLAAGGLREEDQEKFYILAQQFLLGIKRALLYRQVQELAIRDSLTGVFSRRYLMERFSEEIIRSSKFSYKFSVLMVDIDHFKDYNDRYGHFVGDAILKEVSRTIRENIRQIDLVGRYGGEEFVAILAETDKEGAVLAAERIRQGIEKKKIRVYDEDFRMTISLGVAIFPDDSRQAEALIDKADQALYQAKQSGRNRTCIYGTSD